MRRMLAVFRVIVHTDHYFMAFLFMCIIAGCLLPVHAEAEEVSVETDAEQENPDDKKDETGISDETIVTEIEVYIDEMAPEITIEVQQADNNIYSGDVQVTVSVTDPVVNDVYSGLKTISYKVLNMGQVTQSGTLFDFEKMDAENSEPIQTWNGSIRVESKQNNSDDVVIEVFAEDDALNSDTVTRQIRIDVTPPVISVSYNNNDVQNGHYFKEARTATIVIQEHNFDASRVTVTQTGSLNGKSVPVPSVSWRNHGDTHTAVLSYTNDGDYTFDITAKDLAGNEAGAADYGSSAAGRYFTVDTGIEAAAIIGVTDGKSYRDAVNIDIQFNDVNYSVDEIELLRTRINEKDVDVTEQMITNIVRYPQGGYSLNNRIEKTQDNDGIYRLSLIVRDLAGNEKKEIVRFTINRYGSVYRYSDYLSSLNDAYIQAVEQNLVITEYNPDQLLKDSLQILITRDGMPLTNVKYTVNPNVNDKATVGSSGWYQYEYDIDASNFSEDGIYKLSVSSEDTGGNQSDTISNTDYDLLFRVDTTPPEFTNLADIEQTDARFDVFDAIGLKKITVFVEGEAVAEYDSFEDMIRFSGDYVAGEESHQRVRIVAEDMAGNMADTDMAALYPASTFTKETERSSDEPTAWYQNKTVRGISICGIAVVAALIFFRKKRIKAATAVKK